MSSMNHLTGNQKVAMYILGYLPKGNVSCHEVCSGKAAGQGQICLNGTWIASVPVNLHNGRLPRSSQIAL
jgi:hypothetical protein